MDQNKKNSIKNFFRKEGFYLVLFLCLCLVATVAVITAKNNSAVKNEKENEFSLNIDEENVSETQKQNAERVESGIEEVVEEPVGQLTEEVTEEVALEENEDTVAVGTTIEVSFTNPVDGELSRAYTYPTPQKVADGTHRSIRGIDIKSSIGTEVRSAAIGEVKEVSNGAEEGVYVVISHPNGLFTKYTNLSKEVRVNVGDKVTEETVIGTVGDTSKMLTNKEFGEHLSVQVFDSNGKDLDPTQYFQ